MSTNPAPITVADRTIARFVDVVAELEVSCLEAAEARSPSFGRVQQALVAYEQTFKLWAPVSRKPSSVEQNHLFADLETRGNEARSTALHLLAKAGQPAT